MWVRKGCQWLLADAHLKALEGAAGCCLVARASTSLTSGGPAPSHPSTHPSTSKPPNPTGTNAGDSETLKIAITHVHRYDLWVMGVWPVQKRKGMRCGSRAIYERMVVKLSRLLQKGRGEGGDDEAAIDPGLRRFAGADLAGLTILSAPYAPPPPPGRPPGAGAARSIPLALPASLPPSPHAAAH